MAWRYDGDLEWVAVEGYEAPKLRAAS
jgi:hypothetical protein